MLLIIARIYHIWHTYPLPRKDSMEERLAEWIGSSKKDLKALPQEVMRVMGFALRIAQLGGLYEGAKVLKGFHGADVIEILADDEAGTYRGVYTVRFPKALFILHVFQKKSKSGIATPKQDIDLIKSRLKLAETIYNKKYLEKR